MKEWSLGDETTDEGSPGISPTNCLQMLSRQQHREGGAGRTQWTLWVETDKSLGRLSSERTERGMRAAQTESLDWGPQSILSSWQGTEQWICRRKLPVHRGGKKIHPRWQKTKTKKHYMQRWRWQKSWLTAAAAKSLQSCLTLSDLKDCSSPASSVHEIFQARVLEWADIAFSVMTY